MIDPPAIVESPEEAEDDDTPDDGRAPVDVPESDRLDQAREVMPGERRGPVSRELEVPEADAIEQAIEVPLDDDRGE